MVRGRRGYCIGVFFFILVLLYPHSAFALELKTTAQVTLSPLWRERIENMSQVTVDTTSHRNIMYISVQLDRPKDLTIAPQTIQALLFQNNTLIDTQEKTENPSGKNEYTFFYKTHGSYHVILVNKTYEYPFTLKNLFISL